MARPLNEPGVQLPQHWQNAVPHPVAGKCVGKIGAVCDESQALGLAVGLNRLALHIQQRTQKLAPLPGNTAEALQSGSPAKVEQQGLRIIIRVVGGEDAVLFPRGQPVEKAVPNLPAAFLQALAPVPGQLGHVLPQHLDGQPLAFGKGLGKGLVPVRLGPPEHVVYMGQKDPLPGNLSHQPVGQSGGIRPAGIAHHQPARLWQAL